MGVGFRLASGESVRITVWEVRRACLAAKMEEVVLAVTRENCETLIGKNVRVIAAASDNSKEVPAVGGGAQEEKIASDDNSLGKDNKASEEGSTAVGQQKQRQVEAQKGTQS